MFARRGPGSKVAFWLVTAFDAACFVATIFVQTFICFPFKRFWFVLPSLQSVVPVSFDF
jgi:hypothetical protein